MENLFELSAKYQELSNRDDLDPEMIADTLDSIQDVFAIKADNIASWIESNQMQIDWLTKKIQTLRETQTALKNKNKSLNEYLTNSIDKTGLKELDTQNHILKPRNYRASVIINSEQDLPSEYISYEKVAKIDKQMLYADLKAGKEVNGAQLKPNRKVAIK